MKSRSRNGIIIAIVAVVVLILVIVITQLDERYDWTETYTEEGGQPYDISLFLDVLENSSDNYTYLTNVFSDTGYLEQTGANMIMIAKYQSLDSMEITYLKRFIENGNKLFISSRSHSYLLAKGLNLDSTSFLLSIEKQEITLPNDQGGFPFSFDQFNNPVDYSWSYFPEHSKYTELGQFFNENGTYSNHVNINIGDGVLELHSTPLIFTNYHFRKEEVFEHVNEVIGQIENKTIYYLNPTGSFEYNGRPQISESPLRFILANPPLKWAWYIVILLSIIYVFNAMRRKQRPIPIKMLPENQTEAHLEVLYKLYRKEGKHKDLIRIQVKLLQQFLKSKYGINSKNRDDVFYSELSEKLKLETEYLQPFFKDLERAANNSTLTDRELMEIDQNISEFYLKCP